MLINAKEEFNYVFEGNSLRKENQQDWWEHIDTPQEALKLIGKLWNCNDIAPSSTREEVAERLSPYIAKEE
ncbi:MAG TPA: hypothetical protein VEF53_20090 [Patescibacteria group bacterium]|nr:hypothetical protein [Patescibacteria group bacterium]